MKGLACVICRKLEHVSSGQVEEEEEEDRAEG